MSLHHQDEEVLTCRAALKSLAVTTGAVTLTGLPLRWGTPVVEIGSLPAHVYTSYLPFPFTHAFNT